MSDTQIRPDSPTAGSVLQRWTINWPSAHRSRADRPNRQGPAENLRRAPSPSQTWPGANRPDPVRAPDRGDRGTGRHQILECFNGNHPYPIAGKPRRDDRSRPKKFAVLPANKTAAAAQPLPLIRLGHVGGSCVKGQ